ncbi:hypothetical protein [uncultured Eubacterium sp.]|uniref:hypothetical protein n=1 Tax=uncultured Eubacterium sp. TaxID=165185 RepID=UPI00326696C8
MVLTVLIYMVHQCLKRIMPTITIVVFILKMKVVMEIIQEAISKLVKSKTVLVIAHRIRTVENADMIVVLDGGVVAESGTHEQLMKNNGLYAKLVKLQTVSVEWKIK